MPEEHQSHIHIYPEKAYDRVTRKEIWRCTRERIVPEKYVRGFQTKVCRAAGESGSFNVDVGLHQGSALSPYLFLILVGVISEEVGMKTEITIRVGAGWNNWKKCSGVSSIPIWGRTAELRAAMKRQEKRIEVNEMRMLRWIACRGTWGKLTRLSINH